MINNVFGVVILLCLMIGCASKNAVEVESHDSVLAPLQWKEKSPDNTNKSDKVESIYSRIRSDDRRFNVSADKTPVKSFLMSLVKGTEYNLLVADDVNGNISLSLKNVTLMETLDAVRDVFGYNYSVSSYGIQVQKKQLQTKIFSINYINVNRVGSSGMWVSSGQITSAKKQQNSNSLSNTSSSTSPINSTQVNTRSESNFWEQLNTSLQLMLSDNTDSSIVVDSHSGIVVVRAMPSAIRSVEHFLNRSQLISQRQVLIEAKILEISLNENFQSGIQWNNFGKGRSGTVSDTTRDTVASITSQVIKDASSFGGVFSFNFDTKDLSGVVELLETQGDVKVLSSPRIATINNQKAVIKVGNDEYFVTEIKSPTTTSTGGTTSFPEIVFTPFFSGIALDVTPQIGENEEVILHVHPTITEVNEQIKNVELNNGNFSLPLAASSVREIDSVIKARSGQIVVIGGLMQNKKNTQESGIPYLRDIPVLGHLFGQNKESIVQSELVILIQPTVTDRKSNIDEMHRINNKFSGLN